MPTVVSNMMPHLGAMMLGFLISGWLVTLIVLGVASYRNRKAAKHNRALLSEMTQQRSQCEQQRDEYSALLVEAGRELASEGERYTRLAAQLAKQQQVNVTMSHRPSMATIPQAALPSEPSIPDEGEVQRLRKLETSVAELRRSRDASEQHAKKLQATNQQQSRKITELTAQLDDLSHVLNESRSATTQNQTPRISELTAQLDDVALSMEETHIALVERERKLAELTRKLDDSRDQIEALNCLVASGEEQALEAAVRLQVQQDTNTSLNQRLQAAELAVSEQRHAAEELSKKHDAQFGQVEETQAAYARLERMLQESTTTQLQLRRELKSVMRGREDLETQNLELKMILELLGKRTVTTRPIIGAKDGDETAVERRLASVGDWDAVTDGDIDETVVGLVEIPISLTVPKGATAPTQSIPAIEAKSLASEQELRHARIRIEMLESSMGDLEYLREQNTRLNEEWLQDRGAARELSALQMEHRRTKLDLELAYEKLQSQARNLEQLTDVQTELKDRNVELENLARLREKLRDLDAENFALRNANSGVHRAVGRAAGPESDSRDLTAVTLDVAVLSDHLGLPIAATGSLPAESLAAVSGLAARNAEHVRDLLPLGPISTIQWVDQFGMTVTCKLFKLAGDEMAMTTIGSGTPNEQTLNLTLSKILKSIGWSDKGPLSGDESNDESNVATG